MPSTLTYDGYSSEAGRDEPCVWEWRWYELFDVEWSDGARWTAYQDSRDAAEVCERAMRRHGRTGRVVRRVFAMYVPVHIAQPGLSMWEAMTS